MTLNPALNAPDCRHENSKVRSGYCERGRQAIPHELVIIQLSRLGLTLAAVMMIALATPSRTKIHGWSVAVGFTAASYSKPTQKPMPYATVSVVEYREIDGSDWPSPAVRTCVAR